MVEGGVDDGDVLFRFRTLRLRIVVGRGCDIGELLIVGCGWRSHGVCGIYVFNRGEDVRLIRDLSCWRRTSDCEDIGIGFRLLIGDFRHDAVVCGGVWTCGMRL